MMDGPNADYFARLAHRLSFLDYLWEQLTVPEVPALEILQQAREVVEKWKI
jgi:hypothetical protein